MINVNTSTLSPEMLRVFDTLPELYLILSPDLTVLSANTSYLQTTGIEREDVVGRPIFQVFPDDSSESEIFKVKASLQQVLATRKPHQIDRIRYDLPHPTANGQLITRYWSGTNIPMLDKRGAVEYIIHRVTDITEQVETEARLQAFRNQQRQHYQTEEQHNLLQTLLDQAPVAMCLFQGNDLVVASANRLICDIWGYAPEQVLGRPLLEGVPELKGQGFDVLLREVLTTGVPFIGKEMPAQLLRNGQLKTTYYNFVYQPLYDEQQKIIGVVTVAIDVTEQVEARQQIEQSRQKVQTLNEKLSVSNEELRATNEELLEAKTALEQLNSELEERVAARTQEVKHAQADIQRQKDRLERFFMQAPAAICITSGQELVFELVNASYQQFFPERNLLGRPLLEVVPEIADQPIWTVIQNVYQTGETFEGREVLIPLARHKGGSLEDRYFNFIYQARFDEQGQVDGILVFGYEVTDLVLARQRTEQLARRVEEQAQAFDTTLTALQDFIYTFDAQGRFTYANKPLLNLLGITLDEIVGKGFYELPYPQELADTFHAQVTQVVATGQPLTNETPYTSPTGIKGYYEYIFKPIFDQQQQVILVAGSTRDITHRKQSEEALQSKNEELTRINADLDNFIYTASHDLKAPISNIEALLTALLRSLSAENLTDERVQRITAMMQQSVERFKRTIASLTEIVKLQKEYSREAVSVDLLKIIREVRLDLEPMIRASGVALTVDVADCPSVHFSEKNMRSVVYNLLSNAIKYRSPERMPQVLIHCESISKYQVLTVKDNGLGMETGRHSQLFTMFKRFHDHVEGTGIGLYMIKKMVENAGGKIEVDSQLDVGSTFRVYFRQSDVATSLAKET